MNLNANDLLVLHLNVNRTVGNETTNHSYFRENSINVMDSIKKLIDNNLLIIEQNLENSLPKLKVPELKELLRNSNLKVGGNKQELVNRLLDNEDLLDLNSISLPSIYVATSKGNELIEQTSYILHFHNDYTISLPRAHKLAVNNLNSTDKIETIYMLEIKYELEINHDNHRLAILFSSLANYYLKNKNDKENARMYFNLSYYSKIYSRSNILGSSFESNDELTHDVSYYILDPDYLMENFYEQLIFVENTDVEILKNLFVSDIENFFDINYTLADFLINYIVSKIKKDAQNTEYYGLRIFDYFHDNELEHTENNYTHNDNDYNHQTYETNYENNKGTKEKLATKHNKEVKNTATGCLGFLLILITSVFILIS